MTIQKWGWRIPLLAATLLASGLAPAATINLTLKQLTDLIGVHNFNDVTNSTGLCDRRHRVWASDGGSTKFKVTETFSNSSNGQPATIAPGCQNFIQHFVWMDSQLIMTENDSLATDGITVTSVATFTPGTLVLQSAMKPGDSNTGYSSVTISPTAAGSTPVVSGTVSHVSYSQVSSNVLNGYQLADCIGTGSGSSGLNQSSGIFCPATGQLVSQPSGAASTPNGVVIFSHLWVRQD